MRKLIILSVVASVSLLTLPALAQAEDPPIEPKCEPGYEFIFREFHGICVQVLEGTEKMGAYTPPCVEGATALFIPPYPEEVERKGGVGSFKIGWKNPYEYQSKNLPPVFATHYWVWKAGESQLMGKWLTVEGSPAESARFHKVLVNGLSPGTYNVTLSNERTGAYEVWTSGGYMTEPTCHTREVGPYSVVVE